MSATDTDEFPLTCTWCRNRPAAHLAVADWKLKGEPAAKRHPDMLCTPCASQTTVLPGQVVNWWLFDLTLHDYDKEWPS